MKYVLKGNRQLTIADEMLDRYLNEHGVQGSALERPWIPPTE